MEKREGASSLKSGSMRREHEWGLAGRLRAPLRHALVKQRSTLMGGEERASAVVSPADGVGGPRTSAGAALCESVGA